MDQVNDGGAQYLSNFHVVTIFMNKSIMCPFPYSLRLFQGEDPGGESGDGAGDLAAGVHPARLRGARRVRLHPQAGHQAQPQDQRQRRQPQRPRQPQQLRRRRRSVHHDEGMCKRMNEITYCHK